MNRGSCLVNETTQSELADTRDVEGLRFAEIVQYAQVILGSKADRRASQRELSERMGVAATMIGRYKSGLCDWRNLKASTIEALANAAQLEVGTLFIWINQGRAAAMEHQRKASDSPKAFEPLDLAKELVGMLETQARQGIDESENLPPATKPEAEHKVYGEAEAQAISQMCRDTFRRIATDQLLTPREAWEKLKPLCDGMSANDISRFREVVAGWEDWNAEEVNRLSVAGDLGLPAAALDRLGGKLTLPAM
jgi:transcriptional regulator with XRE-family HTH domain